MPSAPLGGVLGTRSSNLLRLTSSRTDKVNSLRACTHQLLAKVLKTLVKPYVSMPNRCFTRMPEPPAPSPPTAMLDPSRARFLRCSSPCAIKNAVFSQVFSSHSFLQPSTAILDHSRTRFLRCSSPSAIKNIVFPKFSEVTHPSKHRFVEHRGGLGAAH